MPRRAYRIDGHVQGVGFRWWTRSQAQRLGLAGRVRNCDDGSVEVQLQGAEAALEQMRRLLLQGPNGAGVREVKETAADSTRRSDFSIES